jgi:glycosyltransferase involved in cell wall biosynthesis
MDLPRYGEVKQKLRETVRDASPLHKYATKPGENHFEFRAGRTRLVCHTIGLGDVMMIRQLGRAFVEYLRRHGDPELGDVVLTSGGYAPKLHQEAGDVHLYWWYSFGPMDDHPEQFFEEHVEPNLDAPPDVVLCASRRFQKEARQRGYDTLYFPIGTYGYEPLDLEREGLGYAGSRWHKSGEKIREMLGPFRDDPEFEWVSEFTLPEQLNLWYNTRLVTFGVTKGAQREWGTVNSRVFETLASGTPLILREHPTVEDILGFDYPYQVSSRAETLDAVDEILSDPEATLAEFSEFSSLVREDHSYVTRLETLFDYLD